MKSEYPTKLARIGSVLVLVGSVIWIQWPLEIEKIGIAPLFSSVGSFIVWLGIEVAGWNEDNGIKVTELDQDAAKFNQIVKIIDKRTYYCLRNKNIETYIRDDDYRGLEDLLAYFEEDAFPFCNEKLQKGFEEFHTLSKTFLNELWTLYSSDGQGYATWRSHMNDWVSDERYDEIMKKIHQLNEQATNLSNKWERFIKCAQIELRGNSLGLAAYKY